MNVRIQEVVEYLELLKEDIDASKRFKEKTEIIIAILTSNEELAIEKALIGLEELNSLEMSSYNRTQVWDVISMLESLKL